MLAKTEDVRSEHHIEEDNYAVALEDMEAKGVDITSSSLGYFTFDPPDSSYTFAEMNGQTSISARAAERAAKLGVLVVTAMGNSGKDLLNPHEGSPADAIAFSVSVRSTSTNKSRTFLLAVQPGWQDQARNCAPGVAIWKQSPNGAFDQAVYSFATPLVSGCCCLLKQAHPEATAQQIRRAVMMTGGNTSHPDTALGWAG